jgi:hypothetical protein
VSWSELVDWVVDGVGGSGPGVFDVSCALASLLPACPTSVSFSSSLVPWVGGLAMSRLRGVRKGDLKGLWRVFEASSRRRRLA